MQLDNYMIIIKYLPLNEKKMINRTAMLILKGNQEKTIKFFKN